MKLLFNALYQSVPSLDVEVIMRLETTRLQDDLLNDVADCGIALPPSPKRALSRFQATLLQIMVIILLHLLNQNSHHQLKYVSHSRQYSALLGRVGDTFKHVSCVFDNSANTIMMLPRDSRYNLALSLLKLDNCRQSYTASGPHVPMCPP